MEYHKGTVSKVFGLYYTVQTDTGSIDCFLKGKNRIKKKFRGYSNPAAVGDVVKYHINEDGSGSIDDVEERTNLFSRKEKGRNSKEDVIAANLDFVLIIQSFGDPFVNPRFVDRLAVRSIKEGITPILCMNKLDLAADEAHDFIDEYYEHSNLTLVKTSAKTKEGVDSLYSLIDGKRTLLAGNSGVGKSSIVNALFPELNIATSETSLKTGKGRHTTTNVIMHESNDKTQLIDSPGVREFGLVDITPDQLSSYFYEYRDYAAYCNFKDCKHDQEPGCKVKELVDEELISHERYVSYINMLDSLRYYQETMYK